MSKFKVWIDTTQGEPILTEWADSLCEQSAKAIYDRVLSIAPEMNGPRGQTELTEGRIEETKGRKAKSPRGHRKAYYVKVRAFGRKSEDLQKIVRKALDAGRF